MHYENGVALQCEDRYVNPECAPDYLSVDFTQVTPTHYLLDVAPLWKRTFRTGRVADGTRGQAARAQDERPCLIVARRTSNRGIPITQARLVHPAGHYQIEGVFKP